MKIAYFTPRFPSSSEVPILNQIVGFIKAGHEINIFAEYKDDEVIHTDVLKFELLDKTYYFPKQPVNLSSNKWINKFLYLIKSIPVAVVLMRNSPRAFFKSLNFIKYRNYSSSLWMLYNASLLSKMDWDYDIVFAQFGPNGEKAAVLKELGLINCKIVTTFRGYDINVIPNTDVLYKNYTYLKIYGDAFICGSNFVRNKLIENGFDEEKINIIPSSLMLEKFNPPKERNYNGIIKILSVGRLVDCKGFKYGIKAMKLLSNKLPNLKFEYIIIGGGELQSELSELIHELELKNVTLIGWLTHDEVLTHMTDSHILLHPAIISDDGSEEAQGNVVQEAQAMEIPVIASDVGGLSDGMIDSESGYLVEQRNANDIVEKIELIIDNKQYLKMGKIGRQFVLNKYSQSNQIKKLQELFERLID